MTNRVRPLFRNNVMAGATGKDVPPRVRSRAALGLTAAAALGRFELQECRDCNAVQYPPRDACYHCLSTRLAWRSQSGMGNLLSETVLHHSNHPYFRERLPWRVGLVHLDAGPSVVAHVHGRASPAPARVQVGARIDPGGRAALIAMPLENIPDMADDKQLREMTCDPKRRKVLVTDGESAVGQSLVRALVAAEADLIWVGYAGSRDTFGQYDELSRLPQVVLKPLDVTDPESVKDLAAEIGDKVDILINDCEFRQTGESDAIDMARSEMEVNYFGLLRLVQEFGPLMRDRSPGQPGAAWVNVLSVFALSSFPGQGTYSASKAAACSLSQCLRAEMGHVGVRVLAVFPGPVDDERGSTLTSDKLAPDALALAIVRALQEGTEDSWPGAVAQDFLSRLRENPKVLECELALQR
jgi:NAD(P)-dependent dehydrogenase (short-subunit alcohol dehydrogenase family)/uncharacterized OB-fold protein